MMLRSHGHYSQCIPLDREIRDAPYHEFMELGPIREQVSQRASLYKQSKKQKEVQYNVEGQKVTALGIWNHTRDTSGTLFVANKSKVREKIKRMIRTVTERSIRVEMR